jgi:hypothetical protein
MNPGTKLAGVLLASAALAGCTPSDTSNKEGMLAAAGFQRHEADTPAKLAKLQAMPQYSLVFSNRKSGPVYIFADSYGCKCAWIGTPDNYQQFQMMRDAQSITQMNVAAAELNVAAANDFATEWGGGIPGWY